MTPKEDECLCAVGWRHCAIHQEEGKEDEGLRLREGSDVSMLPKEAEPTEPADDGLLERCEEFLGPYQAERKHALKHFVRSESSRSTEEIRAELYNEAKEHKRLRDELREQITCAADEALSALKVKAEGFAVTDRAAADRGGGIYFSPDHLRGSAAAYEDMTKHIEQAIRALQKRSERT